MKLCGPFGMDLKFSRQSFNLNNDLLSCIIKENIG